MTVAVTGASGFIGRHAAKELLERGYKITGIDIRPADVKHKNLKNVQCDIVSYGTPERELKTEATRTKTQTEKTCNRPSSTRATLFDCGELLSSG